jgi:AcrR family transcriptional regulator
MSVTLQDCSGSRPHRRKEQGMARTIGSSAEETRLRILEVAQRLFVERGYAGTSVRDIVEQAHLTKGSLYYHFSSKDELLFALTSPLIAAIDEFVAEVRFAGTISPALMARLVDRFDEHAPLLCSLFGDPSVVREMMLRHRLPERVIALQIALGGGDDDASVLRGRCALGVIHAGVLAPGDPMAKTHPHRPRHQPSRLSADEKALVTRAALAVLDIPTTTPQPDKPTMGQKRLSPTGSARAPG